MLSLQVAYFTLLIVRCDIPKTYHWIGHIVRFDLTSTLSDSFLPKYFSHCESFVAEQAVFRIDNNVLKLVWINFLDAYPWTLFVFWRFSRYLRPMKKSSFASVIALLKYLYKHYPKTLKLFVFAKSRFTKRLRCMRTVFETNVGSWEINLHFKPKFFHRPRPYAIENQLFVSLLFESL